MASIEENRSRMIRLRRAAAEDVRTVHAILAAAAEDLVARFGPGHWSTVSSIEKLRNYASDGVLFVVEAGAAAVGTLRLTDSKIGFYHNEWFARPADDAAYLLDMAIDPGSQRRGIGRRSMALAEDAARLLGLKALRLDAYAGPAGAGEFYRKCGYSLVHRSAFRGVALEYFEKLLTDGP
jgi:GNAT superfamily N-acetyltransferase